MTDQATPLNVLLVDDDIDTQTMIRRIMEYNHHVLTIAGNAQDALEHLRRNQAPNIIILDIYLPDSDGYQTLNAIRQLLPKVCIVATTAYYTDATPTDIQARGFDGYLPKPLQAADLMSYIQQIAAN